MNPRGFRDVGRLRTLDKQPSKDMETSGVGTWLRSTAAAGIAVAVFFGGSSVALAEENPVTEPPTDAAVVVDEPQPVVPASYPLKSGAQGALVATTQKQLAWLGYPIAKSELKTKTYGTTTKKAVRAFQIKFWRNPTGSLSANNAKFLKQMAGPIRSLPKQCREGTVICIDMSQKLLRFVTNGKVRKTIDARFGVPGEETVTGTYKVFRRHRDWTSTVYDSPMPFSLFYFGGQAIHFSYYFRKDGYNGGSHGCINTRDWDATRWIFNRSPMGTTVHIYK